MNDAASEPTAETVLLVAAEWLDLFSQYLNVQARKTGDETDRGIVTAYSEENPAERLRLLAAWLQDHPEEFNSLEAAFR